MFGFILECYFSFIKRLAENDFSVDFDTLSTVEKKMCLMLLYDVWQNAGGYHSLEESILAIGKNSLLNHEIVAVTELLIDEIDFIETNISLPYEQPLKVHSRYTRDQILAAFGFSTFNSKSNTKVIYYLC